MYEVNSNNRGTKQLHGKMIEIKFNEEYLQTNQLEKLEKFKSMFCDLRPSKNNATNPFYGLLHLTREDVGLLWNEYSFFGNKPLLAADGRKFRDEILTFCVKNSVEIRNDIDSNYTVF